MYIESDRPFICELEVPRPAFRQEVLETIQFAQDHPDDTWGSPAINVLVEMGGELLRQVAAEPTLKVSVPVVERMLFDGQYEGAEFDLPITRRRAGGWNHSWPDSGRLHGSAKTLLKRRLAMARLYVTNPDLADSFLKSSIIGVHGSGGIAIPDILADGLVSHRELYERGTTPFCGEQLNPQGRAEFVSFVEWDEYETARSYARNLGMVTMSTLLKNAEELDRNYAWMGRKAVEQERLLAKVKSGDLTEWQQQLLHKPFLAVWGLSKEVLRRRQRIPVDSDIKSEFGFVGWGVPKEVLPIILVPSDAVHVVRSAVKSFSPSPSSHVVMDDKALRDALNFRSYATEWLIHNRLHSNKERSGLT